MLIIITVLFGMFCAAMEALVTATILPSVIGELGHMELYPWVTNGFLLAFIVTTPFFGKLSDTYGYKKVYLVAVGVFLVGSTLCGAAQSMIQLVIFRAIQGIGSGGLITMSIVFFGTVYPLDQRPKMQAYLSAMWAIASLIGPAIGALFVEYLNWRWAFYINIPAALIIFAVIGSSKSLPEGKRALEKIDFIGTALFSSGALALIYSLISMSKLTVTPITAMLFVYGVFAIALFYLRSKEISYPILPIPLLKKPMVLTAIILGFFAGFFLFSTASLMPIFIQGALGESVATAGKCVTAVALGSFSGALLCGILLNKIGFRWMTLFGCLFLVLGFVFLLLQGDSITSWQLALAGFSVGIGISTSSNCGVIAVQAASPQNMIGGATSLFHFSRSFGGVIGVAVIGGIQLGIFKRGLEQLSIQVPGIFEKVAMSEGVQGLFDPLQRAALSGQELHLVSSLLGKSILTVFAVSLTLSFAAIYAASRMPKEKPKDFISETTT